MGTAKQRDFSLDFVRAVAIVMVVLCHSLERCLPYNFWPSNGPVPYGMGAQMVMAVGFAIGRIGVPLFFMLSGYLLLDRHFDTGRDVVKFYKSHLLPLLGVWELWVAIYSVHIALSRHQAFYLRKYLEWALMMDRFSINIGWYMPALLAVCVLLPFLARALRDMDARVVGGVVCLEVVFVMLPDMVQYLAKAGITGFDALTTQTGAGLLSAYVTYTVLGWLAKRLQDQEGGQLRMGLVPGLLAWIGLVAVTVLFQLVTYRTQRPSPVYYLCPTLPALGLLSFVGLRMLGRRLGEATAGMGRMLRGAGSSLSHCSFGIFLVHPIVLDLTQIVLKGMGLWRVTSYAVIPILVWLMGKCRPLARLLFRM